MIRMRDSTVNVNNESGNELNVARARSEDMWKIGLCGRTVIVPVFAFL
jgi:hypothetical protein